jgi:hypothetical protein
MSKKVLILVVGVLILPLLLAGCGKKNQESNLGALDTAKAVQGMGEVSKDFEKAQQSGNPEDMAKAMQNYSEVVANLELAEFDKAEAVEPPTNFPKELIYKDGKVMESEDNSSEGYIDLSVTIKTKDDSKKVKDYYKDLFSGSGWKITSQSSGSDSANFVAKNSNGLAASVDLSFYQMGSKLVVINVYYRGDTSLAE